MGPRRIGYYSCDCRGCLNTETVDKMFAKCGSCSIPKYCSKECQLIDWKQRHKVVCKAAKKRYDETKKCGQLMQRLSDLSLTGQLSGGQLSGIGSMREAIHGAKDNDAVKERRKHLKSEQKRYIYYFSEHLQAATEFFVRVTTVCVFEVLKTTSDEETTCFLTPPPPPRNLELESRSNFARQKLIHNFLFRKTVFVFSYTIITRI